MNEAQSHNGEMTSPPEFLVREPETEDNLPEGRAPRMDRSKGNLPQVQALMKRIGYIFADNTVRTLEDPILYDAQRKIVSILQKLNAEVEHRESKFGDAEVDLSPLLKFKPKASAEKSIAGIFRHDDNGEEQLEVARAIVALFQSQGRTTFTMDEAIAVVNSTETMAAILRQADEQGLRIRLGQLFGLNDSRLRVFHDSNRRRIYYLP